MRIERPRRIYQLLRLLLVIVILKATADIISVYGDYFPPNFHRGFLVGRGDYFSGLYGLAFYTHILCGPPILVASLVLMSGRFRASFPRWHRVLGRCHVLLVLLCLFPSGLAMAFYADGGWPSGTGFTTLAFATFICTLMGWRSAVKRRFGEHRRWMIRCFVLLSSVVLLRIVGAVTSATGFDAVWPYQLSAWGSWAIPLAATEAFSLSRATNAGEGHRKSFHADPVA